MKSESGLLRITYVKSCIGYSQRQKDTIRTLGLRRIGETVEHPDTPPVRGMVHAVRHLVAVEPVGAIQVVAGSEEDAADLERESEE
jgi:large subunit ribosomal protein L30